MAFNYKIGEINNEEGCRYFINDIELSKSQVSQRNGIIKIEDLQPIQELNASLSIEVNGIYITISNEKTYNTLPVTIKGDDKNNVSASHIYISPIVDNGDATIIKSYWEEYQGKSGELLITGLEPNSFYTYTYCVEGNNWSTNKTFSFTTQELTMATLPAQAMNTKTALLCAEANVSDEETNVGFEWRRYDAPETLPSSKVACAVIDGKLTGALSGLNPEAYYNYRPYYTSNGGNTYYGEWMTLFTGDANVFFDPTVRTYSPEFLNETSVVLKGYALRGSDDIARQGFQYWSAWGSAAKTRSADNDMKEIVVNGQRISYTLTDLQPSTTYFYRTFVETTSGTVYGEEQTFTTPATTAVSDIRVEDKPLTVTGIYNLHGKRIAEPCKGINIIRYSDGTIKKILKK